MLGLAREVLGQVCCLKEFPVFPEFFFWLFNVSVRSVLAEVRRQQEGLPCELVGCASVAGRWAWGWRVFLLEMQDNCWHSLQGRVGCLQPREERW